MSELRQVAEAINEQRRASEPEERSELARLLARAKAAGRCFVEQWLIENGFLDG